MQYPRRMTREGASIWEALAGDERYTEIFIQRAAAANLFEGYSEEEVLHAFRTLTYRNICLKRGVQPFYTNEDEEVLQ